MVQIEFEEVSRKRLCLERSSLTRPLDCSGKRPDLPIWKQVLQDHLLLNRMIIGHCYCRKFYMHENNVFRHYFMVMHGKKICGIFSCLGIVVW